MEASSWRRRVAQLVCSPPGWLKRAGAARNHNLEAVCVHLVGEALAAAVVLLSSVLGGQGGEGGGVEGAGAVVLKALSFFCECLIMAWVVPIAGDACLVLLQATPLELVRAMSHVVAVNVCVCVCVCLCVHAHTYMHTCMHACLHTPYACTYIR